MAKIGIYDVFESGEYSISGGSGQIKLTIPINLAVTAIGFRFKGISIAGSYPATGVYYSDLVQVSNGGSSGGGVPSGASAAAALYTGISSYAAGPPTDYWTDWADSGIQGDGVTAYAEVQVPNIPDGTTFKTGTWEKYVYNYDGQPRTGYIDGLSQGTVAGSGGYKMQTGALYVGNLGTTMGVNVSGSGAHQRARIRARVQYSGSGYLVETKTGNCSNNYGGNVAGPLNDGQTAQASMSLPSGNIKHSIGGSGLAGFRYAVQYTYQQAYEIKTSNVQASCNGYSCGYGGAINNESWVLPYSGTDAWIRMNPLAFQPGNTANISISVAGSQKCGVKVAYAYTRARPLLLNTLEVRKGSTTTYALPVVSLTDVNLDLDSYVQMLVPTSPEDQTPIIRCVDLVEVDDGDAGPVRINTHHGSKAVRKWQG